MIPGASELVQRAVLLAYWQNTLDKLDNQESQDSQAACSADGKERI